MSHLRAFRRMERVSPTADRVVGHQLPEQEIIIRGLEDTGFWTIQFEGEVIEDGGGTVTNGTLAGNTGPGQEDRVVVTGDATIENNLSPQTERCFEVTSDNLRGFFRLCPMEEVSSTVGEPEPDRAAASIGNCFIGEAVTVGSDLTGTFDLDVDEGGPVTVTLELGPESFVLLERDVQSRVLEPLVENFAVAIPQDFPVGTHSARLVLVSADQQIDSQACEPAEVEVAPTGQVRPEDISVGECTVRPGPVAVGDSVTAQVEVTNEADTVAFPTVVRRLVGPGGTVIEEIAVEADLPPGTTEPQSASIPVTDESLRGQSVRMEWVVRFEGQELGSVACDPVRIGQPEEGAPGAGLAGLLDNPLLLAAAAALAFAIGTGRV